MNSHRLSLVRRSFSVCLLLVPLLAGCGGSGKPPAPTGTLSGKVTYQGGKLEPECAVQIYCPETSFGATAPIGSDGSFSIKEPVQVGNYVVTVQPRVAQPEVVDGKQPDALTPAPAAPKVPYNQKYRDPQSTPLKVTIKEGPNEATFALE